MLDRTLIPDLRDDLRHRLRPMTGRDPDERDRSTTPLELLYDLTYVIAFGAAAEQLAHHISDGHAAAAVGAYVFAIFSVTWAWLNFTWFSSAYGNDDALFRIATIVQMVGVIVLTFGLPVSFTAAADGRSPNNALLVVGYVIMRVPLIALWLRAAAVSVGAFSRKHFVDAEQASDLRGLVFVVALVAAGAIVEVIGHELVGFTHTVDALQRGSGVTDEV